MTDIKPPPVTNFPQIQWPIVFRQFWKARNGFLHLNQQPSAGTIPPHARYNDRSSVSPCHDEERTPTHAGRTSSFNVAERKSPSPPSFINLGISGIRTTNKRWPVPTDIMPSWMFAETTKDRKQKKTKWMHINSIIITKYTIDTYYVIISICTVLLSNAAILSLSYLGIMCFRMAKLFTRNASRKF